MRQSTTIGITLSLCSLLFAGLFFIDEQAIANKPLPKNLYGKITSLELPDIHFQTDSQNQTDWLSLTNKPLFLTTGFTRCKKRCPETMQRYQQLATLIGNHANLALITIDPKQDTQNELKRYLSSYGNQLIGVRIENRQNLESLLHALKQSYTLTKHSYLSEHQDYIYLIHPKVNGMLVYSEHKPDLKLIQEDLTKLSR